MALKIVFSSDWHLGLKTDEIDRTSEIIGIVLDVVEHCRRLREQGHEVVLVVGGDIFNTNTPAENLIAELIRVFGYIKKYGILTYFEAGNHDAVADPNRLSCLSFIRKAKIAYPTINLIEDIKFLKYSTYDTGPVYFTFLPHISKATLFNKIKDGKLKEGTTTQQYIESKCERILTKVGKGSQHYVFSHLNVRGAHGGSEENLLKKSEVYLPSAFTNTPPGYVTPEIIQGHIHSHQQVDNIHIVGSPIYCSFGEKGEKYFCEITHYGELGKKDEINFIPTNYRQFLQLELDMMGETRAFFDIPEVQDFMETIIPEKNPIVKFDISINPENNVYDWKKIREEVGTHNAYVKNIVPRIILKRPVRSVDQKITLTPNDAVKLYLTKNLRKTPNRAKRIYKLAQKYLEA